MEIKDSIERILAAGKVPESTTFVMFRDSLDQIVFVISPCSYDTIDVNPNFSLLEVKKQTSVGRRCIGFIVQKASNFCQKHRLIRSDDSVDLSNVLDALLHAYPESAGQIGKARHLLTISKYPRIVISSG